ncbi:MAG: hypothetical protein U1F56_13820 [Rubrivivax sp.]
MSGVTFGMVVPVGSALRTLDDVFAWARARPGELTVATNGGAGLTPHVVLDEPFARRGITWTHVLLYSTRPSRCWRCRRGR